MALAFERPFEFEKEREKAESGRPEPLETAYGTFREKDQPPIASMLVNEKEVRFDGSIVKLGGVGAVATQPAERRGGAIRVCMEKALRDMYDEGYALSHLYPFSTAYYRQFGFACAGKSQRWRVKLTELKRLPDVGGSVRQLLPGDDLSVLLDIYDKEYGDVNFSCLRKVYDQALEGDKPLAEKRWIWVWSDEDGVPGGLLVGSRKDETLCCVPDFKSRDGLLFTDAKALIGLLHFVSTAFIANFDDLEFSLPDHIDLSGLLPELSNMQCRFILNGMARAVNVEKLLGLCRCRGEGHLTLRVKDSILPENNSTFLLDFAPGRANRVSRTEIPADVELDVGNLSVLLGGCRDVSSLAFTPDLWVNREDAPVAQVFYRKACHILDLY